MAWEKHKQPKSSKFYQIQGSYNVVENVKDASSPKGTLNKRAKEWVKTKLLI